jgi:streptomycin 6-kinase
VKQLVHPRLTWLEELPQGRDWLARVPELLEECAEQWSLRLEEPIGDGFDAVVVGTGDAVLKLQFPDRESEHEAEALRVWNGDGAVRLLAHDPDRHALLVERARPGTHLTAVGQEAALDVFVELLPRLWKPVAAPFRPLADDAAWWIDYLPRGWEHVGRPFERRLLDAVIETLGELAATQGEQVLLHQDLHADNVLNAEREPWLVIDPKPLAGEREFAVAPLVRGYELGHSKRATLRRLDRLTSELGLDRERARGWAAGQAIAWGVDQPGHVEVARWLLEAA